MDATTQAQKKGQCPHVFRGLMQRGVFAIPTEGCSLSLPPLSVPFPFTPSLVIAFPFNAVSIYAFVLSSLFSFPFPLETHVHFGLGGKDFFRAMKA